MIEALEEWRAARQAIFDAPIGKETPELFTRLGHAEHRLMQEARRIHAHKRGEETQ